MDEKKCVSNEVPVILSAKDAQRFLGLSRSMVYKLLNSPNTGSFEIGRRKFFHRDVLFQWLLRQAEGQ